MQIKSGCCDEVLIETTGTAAAWAAHLATPGVDVRCECPSCGSIRCLGSSEGAIVDEAAEGWAP